ncbi:MAG TPA: glycoside hydrolase family 2 TIM barrel-domain containing protein, partial [Armatimonadota bacterium]|nr:glycoside hydrolase family 2 TIM barrel-domain containing protein [Armatimonadota bacterium]
LQILVPFTFEAALSGIGKGKEVHERVWYRRMFDVPESWRSRRVRLNFNASDWETTVWVNGREVGSHRGGYEPFSLDVTEALKSVGPQEVVVGVYDPADPKQGAYQPKGKQLGSEGIWYTRTTGIWQSVWLEPVHAAAIEIAEMKAEVDPQTRLGQLTVGFMIRDPRETTVEMTVSRKGEEIGTQRFVQHIGRGAGPRIAYVAEVVKDCKLWSPESPALYDVTFRSLQGGQVVDEARSYCAFRHYGIKDGRLTLNGKPYFLRGVLDQGYWPDGILTPPTDDAIRYDVEMTKKLGFNMSRKHVKIEDPRWYYWCDRLGVAVWQDMPSSHNLTTPEARANFTKEWTAAIKTTGGYPSVLHWIPFNENWGDPGAFQDETVRLTRTLDPSRPITDASGWTQRALTDVIDAHDYSNNLIAQGVANPVKPKVVGEYGGIALPVEGHTWTTGWGYQTARDPAGLLRRVRHQTTQLFEAPNLSGFVYTQLTDVEQEMNGLLTYDRLPKANPREIAAIFEGRSRANIETTGYVRDWLVLGPIPAGTALRTAEDNPRNQAVLQRMLEQPFVQDEATLAPTEGATTTAGGQPVTWKRLRAAGDSLDFIQAFARQVDNSVVYAVAYVDSPRELKNVTLLFGSDDAARVWLNGAPVWTTAHVRGVNLDGDIVQGLTLKRGRNVLVVKVAQGVGGWGLAARFEKADGSFVAVEPRRQETPAPR